MVCFDVKKEEEELKEGHKGIGACVYDDATTGLWNYDANFFGTVEATGDSSFKFADDKHNDWDTDGGEDSDEDSSFVTISVADLRARFVSKPLDVNSNSPRNLGIKKKKSFWKCYVGQDGPVDTKDPFNHEISLAKFTTDKARRIDTSCIADFASKLVGSMALLIGTLELIF